MKKLAIFLALSAFACLLYGCVHSQPQAGPSDQPESKTAEQPAPQTSSPGTLTLYSPLPESETSLYCSAFRMDTGIDVHCIYVPAGEMAARLAQEQDAPQASVLLGGSADNYVEMRKAGLLEPYQSAELTDVPEAYLDPYGVWDPIYIGAICFACNETWFDRTGHALPQCWDDLLAPALAGQIALMSPETSGTAYTMLATLVQMRGEQAAWRYFQALDRNVGQYTRASSESVDLVKNGDFAVGVVFYHDGRRAVLDGYPVELCVPSDGTGYEIGACALVRGGPRDEQANARRFIDWMTSPRGQECYIEAKSCRLPANSMARAADGLPALADMNLIAYDLEWAGQNRARLVDTFVRQVHGADPTQGPVPSSPVSEKPPQ